MVQHVQVWALALLAQNIVGTLLKWRVLFEIKIWIFWYSVELCWSCDEPSRLMFCGATNLLYKDGRSYGTSPAAKFLWRKKCLNKAWRWCIAVFVLCLTCTKLVTFICYPYNGLVDASSLGDKRRWQCSVVWLFRPHTDSSTYLSHALSNMMTHLSACPGKFIKLIHKVKRFCCEGSTVRMCVLFPHLTVIRLFCCYGTPKYRSLSLSPQKLAIGTHPVAL